MRGIVKFLACWMRKGVTAILPRPLRRWIRQNLRKMLSFYRSVTMRKQDFQNREGFLNFDFSLCETRERNGASALLRVKNEEAKICYSLMSIIDVFDEIVLVDNGSEDATMEVVHKFKDQHDREGKILIYSYPFTMARYGPEHLDTPEDSIRNFAYYSNWALSHCSFRYVFKWDGDMVLRKEAEEPLRNLFKEIQEDVRQCWVIQGQTIYRDLQGNIYLSKDEINSEIRLFPYGYNPRFHKIDLYEALLAQPELPIGIFEGVAFYELKFVSEDEFSHWSINDIPTPRKQKEIENFQLIRSGNICHARFQKLPDDFFEGELTGKVIRVH